MSKLQPSPVSLGRANRRLAAFAVRAFWVLLVVGCASPAFAQAMLGNSLLTFGANYIIGPIGVFAVVVALAASIFRPDMVRGAVYAALICAVLFFVIKESGAILTALRS